jgi:hypothetical protein
MFNLDDVIVDCRTCVASNTTACNECVVSHLLANDAGPIDFVPTPSSELPNDVGRAVALLTAAGLLDAEPCWVAAGDFEEARPLALMSVPELTSVPQLMR